MTVSFLSSYRGILGDHFPVPIYRESTPTALQNNSAEIAAWSFPGCFCFLKGLFEGPEIVSGHFDSEDKCRMSQRSVQNSGKYYSDKYPSLNEAYFLCYSTAKHQFARVRFLCNWKQKRHALMTGELLSLINLRNDSLKHLFGTLLITFFFGLKNENPFRNTLLYLYATSSSACIQKSQLAGRHVQGSRSYFFNTYNQ